MPTAVNLSPVNFRAGAWIGGANTRDAVNLVAPNEVRPIENIVFDERGSAQKRLGCQSLGTIGGNSGARIIGLYTFYRGRGVIPQVLAYTNEGALYWADNMTANPVVWNLIAGATGLSTTRPFSFQTYNSKVYMGNGTDPYCSWDGTSFIQYPSAPRGRYLYLWADSMWVAGVDNLNDRIYTSTFTDPESFPATSYIDVYRGDGDSIRALTSDGQYLVIGKRDRTFVMYDSVHFYNRVVDFEKGFESHFAVAQFEGDLYFISRRGVCQYLGDSPSRVISQKIDPTFDPVLIELDMLAQSTCYVFENRIGFAIPEYGSPTNSVVIEYYPELFTLNSFGARGLGPFTFHRMPTQCFTRWRWQTNDQLIAGHTAQNKALRAFAPVGTDDGAVYQAVIQTAFFDMGSPGLTKYLREMRVLCSGRFDMLIYRDFDPSVYRTIVMDAANAHDLWDTADLWGQGVWGPDSPVKDLRRTNIDAYGRYFSFRFVDSGQTQTNERETFVGSLHEFLTAGEWSVYGIVVEGSVLGKRS